MPQDLSFYFPIPKFPSVSVTGEKCDLQCSHCKGHYLKQMPNVDTPEKLREFCIKHEENGGIGLLVSGGSSKNGKVPLGPFLKTLTWLKENTSLILNLHTGMLNREEAESVASTGVDVVSVDLVGSEKALKRVYGLKVGLNEYNSTLTNLFHSGANVAPHICVGLNYGQVEGEVNAIELASSVKPETIVFISLIPTANTPMADVTPPDIQTIADLISRAVEICKGSEIGLGCMRSRESKTELEWAAVEAGASRIALASKLTERKAIDEGYKIIKLNSCCATPKKCNHLPGLQS